VHEWLSENSSQTVKFGSLPQSGFFIDVPNILGEETYRQQIISIFHLSNATHGLNKECIKNHHEEEYWKCNFAEYTYEHISSRIFPLNSALDSWQTNCEFTFDWDNTCSGAANKTW